jgi:putative transposase
VELKRRNPSYGSLRITQQIKLSFGITIDKDIVRWILTAHFPRESGGGGPSWLTFLGYTKDCLWSVGLFRCESILLKSHWVLVIMDQFTCRVIGFGVHAGVVDGVSLSCMFNKIISCNNIPGRLSSDNDPFFRYHQWQANLRILNIEEIKSIPYTPSSHPFIERLIGTIRRDYLDQLFFWNTQDLERKLTHFTQYYNQDRTHQSLNGKTPESVSNDTQFRCAQLERHAWRSHCNGQFQTPIAA